MTAWVIQGATLNAEIEWKLTWLLWASAFLMFLAFYLLKMSSVPKTKIKSGRLYAIEKVICHNYKDHTVILSYDGNVEIFRCRFVPKLESLMTDKKYTVQKIDSDLIFTQA